MAQNGDLPKISSVLPVSRVQAVESVVGSWPEQHLVQVGTLGLVGPNSAV